jgi:hypothetical protein
MELFVNIPIYPLSTPTRYEEYKLSLFGDEDIELTKSWGANNLLTQYGSYSKSFAIPIDSNNNTAFKNFNVIGAETVDPNYFFTARIIVNSYEIRGNLQIQSFSLKEGIPYSYNVVFYGEEKDLIKELNSSSTPKLNDIQLHSGYTFTWNSSYILSSWQTGTTNPAFPIYVPIMATQRPFCYRDLPEAEWNINWYAVSASTNGNSGITVADLMPSYHTKTLFIDLFDTFGIDITFSSEVEETLNELYIMPNLELLARVAGYTTSINTFTTGSTVETVGITNYCRLKFDGTIYSDTDDFVSWDSLADWTLSTNEWTAPATGTYQLDLDITSDFTKFYGVTPLIYSFIVFDEDDVPVATLSYNNPTARIQISGQFFDNGLKTYRILGHFHYYIQEGLNPWAQFSNNQLSIKTKITKVQERTYGHIQDEIKWADVFVSDFFIQFCKSFNLFFTYNSETKLINVYTKPDLPITTYDLSNYLIINEDYTFLSSPLYKNMNFKFKDGKDSANTIWKNSFNKNYGEYNELFNYDVGNDKLTYTSLFTVFPYTLLNKTDDNNVILSITDIPLHSEIDESLNKIKTDFLLFYKNIPINNTYIYSLQTGLASYQGFNLISNYGPENIATGNILDYNVLPGVVPDNTTQKFETNLSFILPYTILYNLKVYDIILIKGIYYEIIDITINIKTGYTKIKVKTK